MIVVTHYIQVLNTLMTYISLELLNLYHQITAVRHLALVLKYS